MRIFYTCKTVPTSQYQTLATTTYVANMMFIKLSIAIFLLRIAVKRRYTWTLKISMVVIALWSLAIFLYEIFQCTPVQAQWDFTIKNFKCVSGDSFVAAAYSISAMTIVSDWLYAILPIPMIWSVKLTTQAKITVGSFSQWEFCKSFPNQKSNLVYSIC